MSTFTVYSEDETGHRFIEYSDSVADFDEATRRLRQDLGNGASPEFAMDVWLEWHIQRQKYLTAGCSDPSQTVCHQNTPSDRTVYEYRQ